MVIDSSFTLPMRGAQTFWRDKVKMGYGEYVKLEGEAKLKAFAISGIAKGDELNTVFKALQRAIDDGISFDQFKKESDDIFKRRGWAGKRAWRVDNIFRTNIQTAYNVGHYEELQKSKDVMPYWQYSAINDKRTRPTHLAMNNRVYPADHKVWKTWYPPNGYRCRCSVIGLTAHQVESRKLEVETEDPTDLPIMGISAVTGEEELMPRQMIPDPGFDFNPGQTYWKEVEKMISKRLQGYPPALVMMVEAELFELFKEKMPKLAHEGAVVKNTADEAQ